MLTELTVKGFKSLDEVILKFPRLTVLFGPNTAGKSNLLDAVQALSRIGTNRTLSDALSEPIRGYPVEAFAFPKGGLAELLSMKTSSFELEALLEVGKNRYHYRVQIEIQLASGGLTVKDEYLTTLTVRGESKGNPSIEKVADQLRIRRKSKPANPRKEPVGLNYSILSDPRLGGAEYRAIEVVREELSGWRVYYLDPRVAMRTPKPPTDVRDIGVLGADIASFLYRLRADAPKNFEMIKRTLRSLIPSVDDLVVDLDKQRGTLDIQIQQRGTKFSSRVISEGTLRVLALCAIAVNPWSGSLLAFEEPENGVHPRRIGLIAQLLTSLATEQKRQVIVTTHSPLFCDAVLKLSRNRPADIALMNVRRGANGTEVKPFDISGPLFKDQETTEKRLLDAMLLSMQRYKGKNEKKERTGTGKN